MKYFLFDIGSSTIKFYLYQDSILTMLGSQSFNFKEGFEVGLSKTNTVLLMNYFLKMIQDHSLNNKNTKLYATGLFRDIAEKENFIENFYEQTGLFFNIISHDLETFYLEKAWIGRSTYRDSVLVINIGGKTTELILMKDGKSSEKHKLEMGVGSIIQELPEINQEYSQVNLNDVIQKVEERLPNLSFDANVAIYTGGELNYMRLAEYELSKNSFFDDSEHPQMITFEKYCESNKRIFDKVTLSNLQSLMPENPTWMNGARSCSALAQAICGRYGIKYIIPSDTNLMNGICSQEFRSVTVCGSFRQYSEKINVLIKQLQKSGITVISPRSIIPVDIVGGFVLFHGEKVENGRTWPIERKHLLAIDQSDAVVICDFDGYVGRSTSCEIGYAIARGKKVVFLDGSNSHDFDFPCEKGLLNII